MGYYKKSRKYQNNINSISHNNNQTLDLYTIFLFLKKLDKYETGIYQKIRKMIGVPKMYVGSRFRFSNQYTCNLFKVVTIIPVEQNYQNNKGVTTYKYGYTINDYQGIKMLNYIYDCYVEAGYIVIIS